MKFIFESEDILTISKALREVDVEATDENIQKVKDAIEAAFNQQFESEVEHLINDDEDYMS